MRTKANSAQSSGDITVMGVLLGHQTGRVVDISNSFEFTYDRTAEGITINEAFLTRKQEQCMPCSLSCDFSASYDPSQTI